MTGSDIGSVIAAQSALIAALDAGDVAMIEAATQTLSQLLQAMRASNAPTDLRVDRVDHALRQTAAAGTRIDFLSDRTRQRLDTLSQSRGLKRPPIYNALGRFAI